jgi:ribosomal protein S27E
MKRKWTLEKVQIRSNEIHDNKFTILNIERKIAGNKGTYYNFINIKCSKCKYENCVKIDNHINKKQDCPNCLGRAEWTLETIRIASTKLHNDKYTIHNIKMKKIKNRNRSFIDLECKDCKRRNWVYTTSHISQQRGCGGICMGIANRLKQIQFLKVNHILAKELYKLYFLKFTHKVTNEQFYKVGKTKKQIKQRFSNSNYNIEECQVVEGTHLWVAEQEDEFINKYYNNYGYSPQEKFGGHTECFKPEIIKEF